MAVETFLFKRDPEAATTSWFHYDHADDTYTIETVQDVDAILEATKRVRNATDERARWQHHTPVAEVPMAIYARWLRTGAHKDQAYMTKWLNDADNKAFRYRSGRV